MTEQEIERLAGLIVAALLRDRRNRAAAPTGTTSDLPVWSGAAQSLDDVAPSTGQTPGPRSPASAARSPLRRATTAELTNAARAAAAGRGSAPGVAPVGRMTHRPNAEG